MIETSKKGVVLDWLPCIYYLFYFKKKIANVQALINLGSEINAMTQAYTGNLALKVWPTNVGAQKIDSLLL